MKKSNIKTIFRIGDIVKIIVRDYDHLCGFANSILKVNNIKVGNFSNDTYLELLTKRGETIDGGAKIIWISEKEVDFFIN